MYSTSVGNEISGVREPNLSGVVVEQRHRTQETAHRLSLIAMRQWEKALTGAVALPAAAALSTAATVLFATALLERAFEIFETSLAEVGRRVGSEYDPHGEPIVGIVARTNGEKDMRS